jgi:nucleoside-diphosphate-sugar epimerase
VIVDVRDKNSLNSLDNDTDLVILLAAEHTDNVSPVSLYYDVNASGAKNVLEVMEEKGIKNILFTSTVAIYGLNKENPAENNPADPFNDYGKSKWEAEKLLRAWYENDPQQKSLYILRPTVVFGEKNRGNVFNLLKQIKSGKFMMIGSGNNKKSMSYIENIVAFIKFLIDQQPVGYQVYNYADTPDLTTTELVNIIFDKINMSKKPKNIPYTIGYLGGLAFDICAWITGKKFSVSRVRIQKFCATTQFSAEKVKKTGFIPPYSLKEGLQKTIETV